MHGFTAEKYNDRITIIVGVGNVRMFLVEGDERAALIDTGFGVGDLRGFVESLTDKPVFVLNTHCHIDHINGAALWDECYLNENDWPLYDHAYSIERRMAHRGFEDVTVDELNPKREKPFLPLNDGDEFDIGGEVIRAILVPGHSPGSICFLLKNERICIYGDAVGRRSGFTGPNSLPVSAFLKGLRNLKQYDGQYDVILRNHNVLECPLDMLDNVIECAENIVNGTDDKFVLVYHGVPCLAAKAVNESQARVDGKQGNIFYVEEKRA